jgi:hypothetical protein
MEKLWLTLALLFLPAAAFAQTGTIQGYCDQGGVSAAVSGLPSTNKLQGNIPSCTITVYFTGTTTLVPTIFKDASGTPLSNPFTADALGSLLPGHFLFWTATGVGYDVTGKNGIAPNVYPQTVPLLTDVFPGAAGGGGTSTCGPLAGDSTSTNCGNGNFTGTPVTEGQTTTQAYGYLNSDSSPFASQGVAVGTNNLSHNVGTSISSSLAAGVGIGLSNVNYFNTGVAIVGIGQDNANGISPSGSNGVADIVAVGDGNASKIGSTVDDVVAIGAGTANTIPTNSLDIIAIGDGADKQCSTFTGCGSLPNPAVVHDVIAIGDTAASFNQGSDVVAIGDGALGGANVLGAGVGIYNSGNLNVALGSFSLAANTTGTHNVGIGPYAGGDGFVSGTSIGNSNKTGSNNTWIGYDSGPHVTTQLSNTIALGYQAANTQSNQSVIGNSSITSLLLFGCPTGQSVLDDGSGTCYVPGSGGSGGTNVGVNGGSALASANLNGTTPAAGANNINATWQVSGTNVSAEVPFATSSTFGVIKPDGTSCTVTAGVLTCPGTGGAITLASVGAGASPSGLFDFSAATNLKVPIHAGYTAPAVGEIGYDSTNGNLHTNYVGTDLIIAGFPSASLPTSGHCAQFTEIGAWWEITDAGAPCGSGGGSGISGLTAGFIPKAGSATTLTANSHIDDGVTAAATVTITEPVNLNCTTSLCPSQAGFTYNSLAAPTVGSSTTAVYAVDASGHAEASEAGAAYSRICTAANGICSGSGGSVNTIGVTTANGVSGTSSGGADPRLTITLGDITPTSVTGTGTDPFFTLPNNPTHSGANGNLYNNGGNLTFCNGGGCSALGTGALVNITGAVTPTGCTVSGSRCVVPTNVTSVTFASIPGTYTNLKITSSCQTDSSGGQNLDVQFNGDTGSNYIWQQIYAFGTSINTVGNSGLVTHAQIAPVSSSAVSGNWPGVFVTVIPNYSGTTYNKLFSTSGTRQEPTTIQLIQNYAGGWQSTAAITSAKIFVDSGNNLVAGCTFSLYGEM